MKLFNKKQFIKSLMFFCLSYSASAQEFKVELTAEVFSKRKAAASVVQKVRNEVVLEMKKQGLENPDFDLVFNKIEIPEIPSYNIAAEGHVPSAFPFWVLGDVHFNIIMKKAKDWGIPIKVLSSGVTNLRTLYYDHELGEFRYNSSHPTVAASYDNLIGAVNFTPEREKILKNILESTKAVPDYVVRANLITKVGSQGFDEKLMYLANSTQMLNCVDKAALELKKLLDMTYFDVFSGKTQTISYLFFNEFKISKLYINVMSPVERPKDPSELPMVFKVYDEKNLDPIEYPVYTFQDGTCAFPGAIDIFTALDNELRLGKSIGENSKN